MVRKVSTPNVCHPSQGSRDSSNDDSSRDDDGIKFGDSEKERTTEKN